MEEFRKVRKLRSFTPQSASGAFHGICQESPVQYASDTRNALGVVVVVVTVLSSVQCRPILARDSQLQGDRHSRRASTARPLLAYQARWTSYLNFKSKRFVQRKSVRHEAPARCMVHGPQVHVPPGRARSSKCTSAAAADNAFMLLRAKVASATTSRPRPRDPSEKPLIQSGGRRALDLLRPDN